MSASETQPPLPVIEWHPDLVRLITRMPSHIGASFSTEQLFALSRATEPPPSSHALAYRVSIPFFRRRYYVTFFAGRDRRTMARLDREGQTGVKALSIAAIVGTCLLSGMLTFIVIILLYIIKTLLGFDLFEGPSILHEFFH